MTRARAPKAVEVATATRPGHALSAASVGNVMEWYDFAIFGASATVLATTLTTLGDRDGLLVVFGLLAASFLVRPVGSVLVGLLADRRGRREALAVTVVAMAVATTAIGLLPPAASIGVFAPVALVLLRSVQAFSSGGEITAASTYLAEYAPPGQRGRYGGWLNATIAAGTALGISAVALVSEWAGRGVLGEQAWRLPFLVALPLGGIGLYLRWSLAEPPRFLAVRRRRVRAVDVLRSHRSGVVTGALVVAALSGAFNVWFVFVPSALVGGAGLPASQALGAAVIGLVVAAVAAPLVGRLSDRCGLLRVLRWASAALLVAWMPAFVAASNGDMVALIVANIVVGGVLGSMVAPAFVPALFPTAVRATGSGLVYGFGTAVVGGSAPLVATILGRVVPPALVGGYVLVWAAAALVALLLTRRSPSDA